VRFERSTPSGTRIVCECPIELGAKDTPRERKPRRKRASGRTN